MSASNLPADTALSPSAARRRFSAWQATHLCLWIFGIPAALFLALYLTLLVTPLRLPFGSEAAATMVRSALPPTADLQLGAMSLTLENGVWPAVRFSPVRYSDSKSGARVAMDALEIGFSPVRALIGQPGASVTIAGPHVQIIQDLFGTRPTSLETIEDSAGGVPTVRVQEGQDAFPPVVISSTGLDFGGSQPIAMHSDSEWLKLNLENSEKAIADIVDQATQGRFSKLVVRDGTLDMIDAVYGLARRFENIDLNLGPTAFTRNATGKFSASLGGRAMTGTLARTVDDTGASRLEVDVTNIDFAGFLPFLDDPTSVAAVRGAGALSIDVNFGRAGDLRNGQFKVDLTGLDLRIEDAYFPIASSILTIDWSPDRGQFILADSAIQIGQSSARLSGVFGMGLDPKFGPTMGISLKARDVMLHPNDVAAPVLPFDSMEFSGWSAPLYGALGVDRFIARKGNASMEATGRLDMLKAGLGVKMTLAGQGFSADDLKRLWPYVLGEESRRWFVANVTDGTVLRSRMAFNFPVGSLAVGEEDRPIPEGGMQIDLVGSGLVVKPTATMSPVAIDGETRLQVDDSNVTISAGGGRIETAAGPITITNPAIIMDNALPGDSIFEISGDISAPIPAMLDLARAQQPEALGTAQLPLKLEALTGTVTAGLVTTIHVPTEASGRPLDIDYVLNGTVADFASSEPIKDRRIADGQLSFSASQDGYKVAGTADIDGIEAEIEVAGTPTTDPVLKLATTIDVAELKQFGIDTAPFLSGEMRVVAQPIADGAIQIAIDLQNAGVAVRDIGIAKSPGTSGIVGAVIRQTDTLTEVSNIDLAFGTVKLEGALTYDAKAGLQTASFSRFALSKDDSAQLDIGPIDGGYAVDVRGSQLDLKPMLGRYFGLGEGSGGVKTDAFTQTLSLDVKLDRAIGYYATTAFNLNLDLLLRGSDMRRASLTAQFSDGNAMSITTNPAPKGRTLIVAFNDAGTILRLLGVYSQLAGGSGSLVLTTDSDADAETGQLRMNNFAIVDEANVIQVLGNQSDSRAAIADQNRLDFDRTQVDFVRRKDRVEVGNAIVSGSMVGGTARGFIYTDDRRYDLTGTYVPLFGLNNAFQQIPLLGPLLGGRAGEGLLGVTFAVDGPLSSPQFKINPLSALAPGFLRELFEFRAAAPAAAE